MRYSSNRQSRLPKRAQNRRKADMTRRWYSASHLPAQNGAIVVFSNREALGRIEMGQIVEQPHRGANPMHDVLIGLTFVAMVISPAIVAAFSGSSETKSE